MTKDDLRELVHERKLFARVADEIDDDTPIIWDSLSLVWFLTGVEQRFGLALDPEDIEASELGSVAQIHALLLRIRAESKDPSGVSTGPDCGNG